MAKKEKDNYDIIKKPHVKTEYTEKQFEELLKCIEDPLYFCRNFVKVQHPLKGMLPFEPYEYQERMIQSFVNNRNTIALTARQLGKALCIQTPIPTTTGWKTMGDLQIGDRVWGPDGKPTTVIFATDVMYDHECYEVEFHNGEVIVADAEHLWNVEFDKRTGIRHSGNQITTEELIPHWERSTSCKTHVRIPRAQKLQTDDVALTGEGEQQDTHYLIVEIRKTASVPVRCIQVDNESRMYLCGKSMIPTHNTTVAGAFLLWRAMFTPDSTILITANKYLQALEIMDRVRFAYQNLPDYIRAGVTEYNKGTVAFDNGSKIISRATSSDAGRGLSITLLYLDEFAFVPPNKAQEFWTSIQPVLATGGSCIITSTPKNDEDQFAQIWKSAIDVNDEFGNPRPNGLGKNGYFAIEVPWSQHPDRDKKWEKEQRAQLGDRKFEQEFECKFLTDDETLINPYCLQRLTAANPVQYTGTMRWYQVPQPNKIYMVALDPSLGTGRDNAAIQVFQYPEMIQVAEWQHNETDPRGQVRILLQTLLYIDDTLRDFPEQNSEPEIFWTFENNSLGEAILTIVTDTGLDRFPGELVSEKKRSGRRYRIGLNTSNPSKLTACARLKSLLETDRAKINSANLIRELKNFVGTGAGFKAKPGEKDDLVLALLLVTRMLETVMMWSTDSSDMGEGIEEDYLDDMEGGMPIAFS